MAPTERAAGRPVRVGAGRHHARAAAGLSPPTYAHIVRVSVVRGGGFGGLVRTTAADTRRLSPGDRDKLVALVRQAGLLDAPAGSGSGPGPGEPEPDRFTYAVTVEDEGQRREARVLRALVCPMRSGTSSPGSAASTATRKASRDGRRRTARKVSPMTLSAISIRVRSVRDRIPSLR